MRYKYVILHETMFFNGSHSSAYYLCTDEEDAKKKIAELHMLSGIEIFKVIKYVPVEYEVTEPVVTLKG